MINKKGFTLIELVASMAMISLVLIIAIQMPTGILRKYKNYQAFYLDTSAMQIIDLSIQSDIQGVNPPILNEGKTLKIGETSYLFNNDNIVRTHEGKDIIIKAKDAKYSLDNDFLYIEVGEKPLKLKYNLR